MSALLQDVGMALLDRAPDLFFHVIAWRAKQRIGPDRYVPLDESRLGIKQGHVVLLCNQLPYEADMPLSECRFPSLGLKTAWPC
jgi:hypothetical protein